MGNIVLSVDNNVTYLSGRLGSEVYKDLKKGLGYKPEQAHFLIENHEKKYKDAEGNFKKGEEWREGWDGTISTLCWNRSTCKCNIKKKGTHFPTGLLSKACEVLKRYNIDYSFKDLRQEYEHIDDLSMSDEFEIRDYQQEVIQVVSKADRGIIKAATGSGKTSIAAGLISKIGVFPTIFYVPSIDLMLQSKNEMEKFIRKNGEEIKVGMVGGGKKDIQDITVMTIQTAVRSLGGVWVKYDEEDTSKDETDIEDMKEKIVNLIRNAKLIICDEIQHWAAETCQIISDNSVLARHRWGVSATPWRDQGDDILIDGCFGKCFADISASLLIKKKYLVKPYINIINIPQTINIKKKSYAQIYKYGIVENELRNSYIKNIAETYYESGRNILILVKQIAHGKLLEKMIPNSFFLYGNHSMKKREKHLEKMRNGEARLTISSVIFDEGIDCKSLDTLILAGSGKSPTRALQRVGRVLRTFPDKDGAIVVDFLDNYKYLKAHSSKRIKMYRTEPEFVIRTINP